ncbi:VOC family protein [Clostridium botulinum]|nr:VOC family protein [Clostridium botulinum]
MDLEFKLRSLYICVKNMERAIDFYENLLEQKVTEENNICSVFDINGFRYGLFANDKMNEIKKWGNNCLSSLEVSNIDLVMKKLEELNCKIVFPLTIIGKNQVLEFIDSEGNCIEITCPLH